MQVELYGGKIITESDFHTQIAELLNFESYYGRNLDALWDYLSTDVERPVKLIWRDSNISRDRLGQATFDRIIEVLIRTQDFDINSGWSDRFEFKLQ